VNVLGLETSCDETSAAVVRDGTDLLANAVSSQIAVHRPYGGVVPELASRNHLQLIDTIVTDALREAKLSFNDLDAVAATYGPGLSSSLLIGLNAGKGIALALGVPFIAINHMEAHLYSPLITSTLQPSNTPFPFICLIVSGGHTILAHATGIGQHEILGQTLDDAAGEAFDKVAKLLGLGYPGGPEIDRLTQNGNPAAIAFPRSMLDDPSHNFSFSGLKTAVMYYLRKNGCSGGLRPPLASEPENRRSQSAATIADVCASFQEAVVDVLVGKTVRAAEERGVRVVAAAGGVSVNRRFRAKLAETCWQRGWQLLLAEPALCTDNAAMIAALAYHKLPAADWAVDVEPSVGLV